MKHLITILTLVLTTLLSLSSMAAPVSPEKAREKAIKLFSSRMQTRAVPEFELIWDGETAATRSTQDAALYIFDRTDGPGFIIIAGDDAVPTVLGYSFEHNFGRGTMPENLHYWLSCQRQMVLAAREAGAPTIADLPELGATQVLLETADWDQSEPYNRQTPLYGGQPTLTGSVATAAAIVCKYNQWPDMGNGPTTSYTTRGDGKGLEIGFNNRYLMDALRYAPAEKVRMEMNTGISPCIITPTDGSDNFLYMVLPVRLKAQ